MLSGGEIARHDEQAYTMRRAPESGRSARPGDRPRDTGPFAKGHESLIVSDDAKRTLTGANCERFRK